MAADGAALIAAAVRAAVQAKAPRKTVAATAAAVASALLAAQRAGAAPGPKAPAGAKRSALPPEGASSEVLLEAMRAAWRARRKRKRERRRAARGSSAAVPETDQAEGRSEAVVGATAEDASGTEGDGAPPAALPPCQTASVESNMGLTRGDLQRHDAAEKPAGQRTPSSLSECTRSSAVERLEADAFKARLANAESAASTSVAPVAAGKGRRRKGRPPGGGQA